MSTCLRAHCTIICMRCAALIEVILWYLSKKSVTSEHSHCVLRASAMCEYACARSQSCERVSVKLLHARVTRTRYAYAHSLRARALVTRTRYAHALGALVSLTSEYSSTRTRWLDCDLRSSDLQGLLRRTISISNEYEVLDVKISSDGKTEWVAVELLQPEILETSLLSMLQPTEKH